MALYTANKYTYDLTEHTLCNLSCTMSCKTNGANAPLKYMYICSMCITSLCIKSAPHLLSLELRHLLYSEEGKVVQSMHFMQIEVYMYTFFWHHTIMCNNT